MDRKEKLLKLFESIADEKKELAVKLVDEILFLESELEEIKKIPFYKILNGKIYETNSLKIYKELSTQYNVDIKTLTNCFLKQNTEDSSPLEDFLKNKY